MKNTSQIIEVCALVTFAAFTMPPQQMFAHSFASSRQQSNSPSENALWKAIIITEIMSDPSPTQGLPEVEYVELYNRTSTAISLANWLFSDATGSITLPEFVLQPRQYVVMTSKLAALSASNVIVVANLPSLNNSGDSLTLADPAGNVIDILTYSDDWYRDARKSDGGWSLELIDPENICEEAGNWNVAEDPQGGTPGEQNSILASNPDVNGPFLISIEPMDKLTLRLVFDEKLASDALSSGHWIVTPSLGVFAVSFGDDSRTAIELHLTDPMATGVLYSLSLRSVFDCAGNVLQESLHHTFALPEAATYGDIVINEVLFNPPPDGVDFVELFNASDKYIDLNGWAIGSLDDDGNVNKTVIRQTTIVRPNGYVAFSADRAKLKSQYDVPVSVIRELYCRPIRTIVVG